MQFILLLKPLRVIAPGEKITYEDINNVSRWSITEVSDSVT
jgi:hypothetical protein